ncbi:MAG: bacterioferritin, partial [Spirochaetes bacterium]|nr:bacterioferritin [Spirochaetota bacterium]
MSNLGKITIGSDVTKMLESDRLAEMGAIKAYNDAIKLAGDVSDYATREVLESILKDEDDHMDGIEELQDQIGHMTLPIFLTTQIG